jgi:hypothetical protein
MKKATKISLVIIPLGLIAVLAGIVWLVTRSDEPGAATLSHTGTADSFVVQVERPRMDRPFGGIFPLGLEGRLFGNRLRFDHASKDARVVSISLNRLELAADGWELLIEKDGEGKITDGTHLVFPIEIAEKLWSLRCRPAEPAKGYLSTTMRASSEVIDGDFLIELGHCVDVKTGKILDTEAGGRPGQAWPESPLTLRGSFAGLTPENNQDRPATGDR